VQPAQSQAARDGPGGVTSASGVVYRPGTSKQLRCEVASLGAPTLMTTLKAARHMNTPPSTLAAYRSLRLFAATGWLGVSLIVATTSVALLRYQGPFTLLNLTISELGLLPDSPAAAVFNAGLIGGGGCLAVFFVGLGRQLGRVMRPLFSALGAITGVATALVGVFPVDHPLHQVVGPTCFVAGLLITLLFAASALLGDGRSIPRWLALPSLVASAGLGLYISMPLLLPDGVNQVFAAPDAATRPAVWIVALSEWAAFGVVLLWVSITAWQMSAGRMSLPNAPEADSSVAHPEKKNAPVA
jgi:hypothetical membrane protein